MSNSERLNTERLGEVITFYSYKGGTGRTMALANVACILARQVPANNGVLMVDWDLEAPGLHRYFPRGLGPLFNMEYGDRSAQPGLIDLFWELKALLDRENFDAQDDSEELAPLLLDELDIGSFIIPTEVSNLYLLRAGRVDNHYSSRVNTFRWEELYTRAPSLIRSFAERLAQRYQFVLIDSRTGVSDISGISTMLAPEKLVVVFTPNRQSISGAIDVAREALEYRRQSDDLRPLAVFPLASRIEPTEPRLLDLWRYGGRDFDGYQPAFQSLFKEAYALPECDLEPYFDEVQIQHVPRYAYGEDIAVLSERSRDRLSLSRSYESIAARLVSPLYPWEDPAAESIAQARVVEVLLGVSQYFVTATDLLSRRNERIDRASGQIATLEEPLRLLDKDKASPERIAELEDRIAKIVSAYTAETIQWVNEAEKELPSMGRYWEQFTASVPAYCSKLSLATDAERMYASELQNTMMGFATSLERLLKTLQRDRISTRVEGWIEVTRQEAHLFDQWRRQIEQANNALQAALKVLDRRLHAAT